MRWILFAIAIIFVPCDRGGKTDVVKNPFADTRLEPIVTGGTQSHGGYSSGCIEGAIALIPQSDKQWEVLNPRRRRFFGTPAMRTFLEFLSAKNGKIGMGDVAQPAGGPLIGDHLSHQTGLDADLQYEILDPAHRLPADELESHPDVIVGYHRMAGFPEHPHVESGMFPGKWNRRLSHLLETAATYPQTERIFVTPSLKVELCREYAVKGKYPAWLRKLRPWWGHDDHFHVRLACPADNVDCVKQEPVVIAADDASGVGCSGSDLDWWFNQDPNRVSAKPKESASFLTDEIANRKKDEAKARLSEAERARLAAVEVPRWQKALEGLPAKCKELEARMMLDLKGRGL